MRPYNEKISIYHGMASTIANNITGNFFPIFTITILGATNYQVGLISSLPPLMALLMTIPAAVMINKAHTQRKLVAGSVMLARLIFLLMISVIYLPAEYAAWFFLGLVALMNVPNTVANIGWQAFISNIVDESRRGAFFSDRNRLLTVAGMISTLTIGLVMKDASESALAYQIVFGLAFAFGLLEVFLLMKHKEEIGESTGPIVKKKLMDWSIFNHSNYVWFLIAALFFNFAWQMAWGIFNIYNVRIAGATIFWLSIFSAGASLAQIFSFPLWKKWAEKKSNTAVFVWAAIGMATTPFLTVLSTNLFYLTIVQTTSGFFVAGVVLLLFNLLLEQSPSEKRTYCITTYNVLLSVVAFIAPQVGIGLLEWLGVNMAMNICSILRFASAGLFFLVSMKYAKTPSTTAQI